MRLGALVAALVVVAAAPRFRSVAPPIGTVTGDRSAAIPAHSATRR
jgi:hypothetical protein